MHPVLILVLIFGTKCLKYYLKICYVLKIMSITTQSSEQIAALVLKNQLTTSLTTPFHSSLSCTGLPLLMHSLHSKSIFTLSNDLHLRLPGGFLSQWVFRKTLRAIVFCCILCRWPHNPNHLNFITPRILGLL